MGQMSNVKDTILWKEESDFYADRAFRDMKDPFDVPENDKYASILVKLLAKQSIKKFWISVAHTASLARY